MLESKKFEKTIIIVTIVALIIALVLTVFPSAFSLIANEKADNQYPVKLFGKNIINIDIAVDEATWDKMIEDKMSKPYISCDLTIDGEKFNQVGLRPKGNSSLTNVQGERLSFRLNFDYYIDNQTCYGLTKMVLNNLQADSTYMKDYIAYDLMQYMGVNAPLHNYAFITLNGEPFGVYLAAEVYDEDYLKRAYNDTSYQLYSVKSSGFNSYEKAEIDPETCKVISSEGKELPQGMGGPGNQPPSGEMPPSPPDDAALSEQPPRADSPAGDNMGIQVSSDNTPPNFGGNGAPPAPPGEEGGGGDLVYTDNNTESYQHIFANSVFDNADAEDYAKVIRAIKYLNKENVTQEELERYWNVDEILRYFAVHNFMVNGDSYTGSMKQNYFIAEKDGKITILPWDYNLSFGQGPGGPPPGGGGSREGSPAGENVIDRNNTQPDGNMNPGDFSPPNMGSNADSIVNYAIDTPLIGLEMEDRPLVSVLFGFDEYKEKYHQYLNELTQYVSSDFITKLETVEKDIYPYVQKETVTFFSSEEHVKGFEVLKQFLVARSESIQKQLNGTLASDTDNQRDEDLVKVDFSLNDMGSMGDPGGSPMGNEQNGMQPPPPPGGGQNGMQPPPLPGMNGEQNNGNGMIATILSLVILGVGILGVILFKRKY